MKILKHDKDNMILLIENDRYKIIRSAKYNYTLNKKNGYFERWGIDKKDDPQVGPSPEIWDCEISTSIQHKDIYKYPIERLVKDKGCISNCKFCYKSNSSKLLTYNMTFDEFKIIFDKMPKTLISIAFGIMNYDTNPDFIKMANYAKENGVTPTFTMHGKDEITEKRIKEIINTFGALAVSVYNKDKSYNWIQALTEAGMKQVNIHLYTSEETLPKVYEIFKDSKTDLRLSKLNAIVLLHNKRKGNALKNDMHGVNDKDYTDLINFIVDNNLKVGFDSCGANRFLNVALKRGKEYYNSVKDLAEPCEAGCFSSYSNAEGKFFACSFMEKEGMWSEGIDLFSIKDYTIDVWNNPLTIKWRKILLDNCRNCPQYTV